MSGASLATGEGYRAECDQDSQPQDIPCKEEVAAVWAGYTGHEKDERFVKGSKKAESYLAIFRVNEKGRGWIEYSVLLKFYGITSIFGRAVASSISTSITHIIASNVKKECERVGGSIAESIVTRLSGSQNRKAELA